MVDRRLDLRADALRAQELAILLDDFMMHATMRRVIDDEHRRIEYGKQLPSDERGRAGVRPQSNAPGAGAFLHRSSLPRAAAFGAACAAIASAAGHTQSQRRTVHFDCRGGRMQPSCLAAYLFERENFC